MIGSVRRVESNSTQTVFSASRNSTRRTAVDLAQTRGGQHGGFSGHFAVPVENVNSRHESSLAGHPRSSAGRNAGPLARNLQFGQIIRDLRVGPVLRADKLATDVPVAIDDVSFRDQHRAVQRIDALIGVPYREQVHVVL